MCKNSDIKPHFVGNGRVWYGEQCPYPFDYPQNPCFKITRETQENKKSPGSTGEQGLLGGLLTRLETVENRILAEKAGFEPAEGFTPRTLSRRVT
jgi:hypothetical protein